MILNCTRWQGSSSRVCVLGRWSSSKLPLLPGLLWPGVVISVKGPIYGLNRYLYSAALRLYPFMEKAMEVNPEYKLGVESLRRLDVSGGFLPATPAAKLIPNVLPCIPLDLFSEAERGAMLCGQRTASIYLCPVQRPGEVTPVSPSPVRAQHNQTHGVFHYLTR